MNTSQSCFYFRIAKSTAESAKNFINISCTLSVRQQMRMASTYYTGIFDTSQIHLPEKVASRDDLPKGCQFYDKLSQFMTEKDILCSEIVWNGHMYKNGNIVVTHIDDENRITVGSIQCILVRSKSVFFVLLQATCSRSELNFFLSEKCENIPRFVKASDLRDFKPLIKYGTDLKFKFYLHHHVSYAYM